MAATQTGVRLESLVFHRDSETYRAQYDRKTTVASMAVVATLAEVMDIDPVELEPLHYTIDTDALDEFVQVRSTTNGPVHVSFSFEGYAITVSSDGMVAVAPLE